MGSLIAGLLSGWVVLALATELPSYSATQLLSYSVTQSGSACTQALPARPLPELPEASGVALSRRTPGVVWALNDSSDPMLFALDGSGAVKGRVQVTGAKVADWEDLAVGPCPRGACLYIADIGDNNRARRQVTIYRVPEPRVEDKATEPAESWPLAYPDGAHDAEAIFITSDGQLFVITKDDQKRTALYRATVGRGFTPRPTGREQPTYDRLERVAPLPLTDVTGAAASADGAWVAVRGNTELFLYRAQDLVAGGKAQAQRFDLTSLKEPQGEGVAFGADGLIYLVSEGGSGSGTLTTIRCPLR